MRQHDYVKDFYNITVDQENGRSDKEIYNSSIQSGAHGEKYQNDVTLLLLERAARQDIPFRLAYEMTDAGKFDDVVMYDESQKEWILVQTKHSINSKPIEWESLFPDAKDRDKKSDFSLFMYLKSFLEVEKMDFCRDSCSRRYFIFTNRDVKASDKLEPCRSKHKLLECSDSKHLKLVPTDDIVKLLLDYVNQDLQRLGEAIVELFISGKVATILQDYKTPLKKVLFKSNGALKFSDDFIRKSSNSVFKSDVDGESNTDDGLYEFLTSKQLDLEVIEQPINKEINKLLEGDSRKKTLPSFVKRPKVVEFLNNLVLAVGQPDDIRSIINTELQTWLKFCIPPDDFGKMTQTQLALPANILDENFQKFNEHLVKESIKKYFKLSDGKNILKAIRGEMETQLRNPLAPGWETIKNYYINRRILYYEKEDDEGHAQEKESTVKIPLSQKMIRDSDFVMQMKDKFLKQKCLILIAEPGTGKSVLLQYVSLELQRQKICSVFLIYLSHLQSKLNDAKAITTLDEALDTIQSVISENHCKAIRSATNNATGNDRFVIFCDGFDEVHPDQRETLIQILEQLLSVECVHIVISGRKSVKALLENQFNSKAMGIVPFNEHEQKTFLQYFWNISSEDRPKRFELYCNSLLKKFNADIKSSQYEFTGLPLMIRMLAETYETHFQNFWRSNRHMGEGEMFPSKTMDIVDLFEKFVVKCFKVKINKKLGVSIPEEKIDDEFDDMYDRFVEEHQALALRQLNLTELQRSLHSKKRFNESYEKFTARISKGTEKSSLVHTIDNEIQFTHLSYAEYLVAKLLFDRIITFYQQFSATFEQHKAIRRFFFKMFEKSELGVKSKYFGILHTQLSYHMAVYACEANCFDLMKRYDDDHRLQKLCRHRQGHLLHVSVKNDCDKICSFLINDCKYDVNCTNKYRETPLHVAAYNGFPEVLSLLLDNGAAVNVQKLNKWAPLHSAADRGNAKIIELLIGKGATVDIQAIDKWTPLLSAAQSGHLEVVKLLVSNGAAVDSQFKENLTAFHIAFINGHADIVKYLLEQGVSGDILNDQWSILNTAVINGHVDALKVLLENSSQNFIQQLFEGRLLHMAALYGHTDVARLLIEWNFPLDVREGRKSTPLHVAADEGYADIVELLIEKGASLTIEDEDGWMPLHYAANKGHIKVAKLLVKKHVAVNVQEVDKYTPLHLASKRGHKHVVKLLLENGALQDISLINQITPLHSAAENGHTDVVRLLLENEQDRTTYVNIQEQAKCTPLHFAAKSGHTETVQLLIELGAPIGIQNESLWTPLHFAAQYGQLGVVKKLCDMGAEVNVQQMGGWAPLHFAAQNGHTEVMNLLIDQGASVDIQQLDKWTPLYIAANNGFVNAVKLLIEKGAEVNTEEVGGWTPLHFAAQNGHFSVVMLLIQMGAKVNLENTNTPIRLAIKNYHFHIAKLLLEKYGSAGIEPEDMLKMLHYATQYGHVYCAQLLIETGVDFQQENGWTPLHTAVQNGNVEIVELLLEAKYDVNIRTICGHTPLHIAIIHGRQEVIELLLNNFADIDIVNEKGECALDLASSNKNEQIVDMLMNISISPVNRLGPPP